ncbi:MAG: hypothetical protein ABI822_00875 [Bryobacteraceae bacterium]
MSTSPEFEAFLARVYVDAEFRLRFLADPLGEARRAGLSEAEAVALDEMDRGGLKLAAGSYQAKRNGKMTRERRKGWLGRFLHR